MPEWTGSQLDAKRQQALDSLRAAMPDMLDHREWIQLTETLWQVMSDRLADAQLDVIRRERFETKEHSSAVTALERLNRVSRYKKILRALNFVFKCFDVDWNVFLRTLLDLAEGRADAKGLDSSARRDQQDHSAVENGEGDDDSGSSPQV